MPLSPHSLAEARLLGLNRRNAAINAANQRRTHQEALAASQYAAGNQRLSDTQQYFEDNPQALAQANADIAARNASQAEIDRSAGVVTDRTLNPLQDIGSQAQQGAAQQKLNASLMFPTGEKQQLNQQGFQTYDAQTGQTTMQLTGIGAINQSLIEHLREAGKPDSEIRTILNDPVRLKSIQDTMSNTGLGSTAQMSPQLTYEQQIKNQRDAELAAVKNTKQVIGGYDKNGIAQWTTITDPDAENKRAAIKNRFAQEDFTETNKKDQAIQKSGANAAGQEKTQETTKPPSKEQTMLTGTLQSLIDSTTDPASKALGQAALQTYLASQQNEETITEGALAISKSLEEQKTDLQETLKTMAGMQTDLNTTISVNAKKIQEENQKAADQAEQAQKERLQMEEFNMRTKLSDEKVKAVEGKIAEMALKGRFGSDGALQEVDNAKIQYDKLLQNLAMEVSVQKTEIASKFTGIRTQINNDYLTTTTNALKDFYGNLQTLGLQGLAGRSAIATAENNALKDFVTGITGARKDAAKALTDGIKDMSVVMNQSRADKRADEKDALSSLQWAVDTFGDKAPTSLVTELQSRLPNVDVSSYFASPTRDQVNDVITRAAKDEKGMADRQVSEIAKMRIEGEDSPIGLLAARALGRRTTKQRLDEAPLMEDLINAGDVGAVKEQIMITANNSFDTKTRRELDAITESTIDIGLIKEKLKNFDNKYGGIFKAAKEGAAKFIKERDAMWLDLKADIGSQMAETRKKFAGVAVTETELAQLQSFMIDFKFDVTSEMGIKLDNALQNMKIAEQSKYDRLLGDGAYDYLTGEGVKVQKAGIESWDDSRMQLELPSQRSSDTSDTSDLQSGTFSGRQVILAAPAFDAFSRANEDFKRDHGSEIKIGAVATSSTRDQSSTIKSMANRHGIPFDPSNPNAAAKKLRDSGRPVANVGGSLHEKGLAVDLYPSEIDIGGKKMSAHEYIALVRPYLERYGLKQANHQGNDPGNFEYSPS